MKVLVDTNVMIDVLQNRQPWVLDGTSIFRAVAVQQITGCITAKQIADIHFFSRKLFSGQDNVDARTRQITGRILSLFTLIDTLASDCRDALGNSNGDYEDAMLIAAAVRTGMDYIITRNMEHFKGSAVPAILPADFVKLLRNFSTDTRA